MTFDGKFFVFVCLFIPFNNRQYSHSGLKFDDHQQQVSVESKKKVKKMLSGRQLIYLAGRISHTLIRTRT